MRFALTPEQISTANHWYETLTQEIVATQQTKGLDHDEPYYGAIGGGMRWDFTHTPAGWRSGAFEYHTKRTIDLGPAEETRERSRFALDEAQVAKVAAWRGRPGFDGLVVSFY